MPPRASRPRLRLPVAVGTDPEPPRGAAAGRVGELERFDDPAADGDERAAALVRERLGAVRPDCLDRLADDDRLARVARLSGVLPSEIGIDSYQTVLPDSSDPLRNVTPRRLTHEISQKFSTVARSAVETSSRSRPGGFAPARSSVRPARRRSTRRRATLPRSPAGASDAYARSVETRTSSSASDRS